MNDFKIPAIKVGPVQVSPEINFPDLPKFHSGGVVPGPRGADVPIMAQAGETVTPAAGGGGMNVTVMVSGDTDPDGAARRIAELLRRYERINGSLN